MRRLDVTGFTHDDVLASVFARGAWRPRFRCDVYDLEGNPAPFDVQITEASIDFDASRPIHHSFSVEMEAVPEMLRSPFQWVFAPWLGFGPIRGQTAWLPYGRYLFPIPSRTVNFLQSDEPVTTWNVTMGDLNHGHNLAGPGLGAFILEQGAVVTDDGIMRAASRAGETDLSQIQHAEDVSIERLSWNARTGPKASRDDGAVAFAQAYAAWTATKRQIHEIEKANKDRHRKRQLPVPELGDAPPRLTFRDLDERGLMWLDIETVCHQLVGYHPPHRNLNGQYVARPAVSPASTNPDVVLITDGRSIIATEPRIDPDITGLANIVILTAKASRDPDAGTVVGYADLDLMFPNHPLAPSNCKRELHTFPESETAMAYEAAQQLAETLLIDRLVGYETVSVDLATVDPRHEAFETLGLQVTGDAEYGTAQTMIETAWRIDATAGLMHLDLSRTFRDAYAAQTAPVSVATTPGAGGIQELALESAGDVVLLEDSTSILLESSS